MCGFAIFLRVWEIGVMENVFTGGDSMPSSSSFLPSNRSIRLYAVAQSHRWWCRYSGTLAKFGLAVLRPASYSWNFKVKHLVNLWIIVG